MAKKLYDAEGKPLGEAEPPSEKRYFDVNGTPLFTPPPGYNPTESHGATPQEMTEVAKQAAPYLGRLASESLPAIGGALGGIPGAGIGSLASMGIRAAAPGAFGQPPEGPFEFAKNLGVDLLSQGVLPKILTEMGPGGTPIISRAAFRNFPAVKEGAAREMTSQIMSQYGAQPESRILLQAGKEAKDLHESLSNVGSLNPNNPAIGRQAQQILDERFGNNSVGQALVKLRQEAEAGTDIAKSQTYKSISNTAYSDLTHLRNMKLVTNPQTVADLGYNKLLGGGEESLDARKILKELGGKNKEIYEEGLGATLPDFKEALGEIAKQQKSGILDNILNWSKGHLVWSGMGAVGIGYFHPLAGVGASVPVVTNAVLGRMMSNPQTAKLVVQALRTSRTAPQADFISKALIGALRGAETVATTPEQ